VTLLLFGALATGSIGLQSWGSKQPDWPQPMPNNPVVSQDQLARDLRDDKEERNNSYVPGLGYYHSLYRTWYPYPFNYWYSGFGYYRGGDWYPDSWNGAVPPTSKPHWNTVTQVPAGPAGYSYFHAHGFSTYGSSSESGISRGIFTSPHSSAEGHSFGGFHFGG
jgi:hypothetical protein